MQRRFMAVSLVVVLATLSLSLIGCGKYNQLKAKKAFKEANQFYQTQDYRRAAEKYQEVIDNDPDYTVAYFYLANSLDNLYKPSKKGDKTNDEYLTKAIGFYRTAAERETDPILRKRATEFLVAAYGPEKLADPALAAPLLEKMIQMDPADPNNYFGLAKLYEDSGQYDQAEQQYLKAKEVRPKDPAVYGQLAGYYNRQGEFDKTIETYEQWAQIDPNNPEVYYTLAAFLWEKVFKDTKLKDTEKRQYIAKGMENIDKALQLKPEYPEALTNKGLLIRETARLEKDPAKFAELIKQANVLSDRANEVRKKKAAGLTR